MEVPESDEPDFILVAPLQASSPSPLVESIEAERNDSRSPRTVPSPFISTDTRAADDEVPAQEPTPMITETAVSSDFSPVPVDGDYANPATGESLVFRSAGAQFCPLSSPSPSKHSSFGTPLEQGADGPPDPEIVYPEMVADGPARCEADSVSEATNVASVDDQDETMAEVKFASGGHARCEADSVSEATNFAYVDVQGDTMMDIEFAAPAVADVQELAAFQRVPPITSFDSAGVHSGEEFQGRENDVNSVEHACPPVISTSSAAEPSSPARVPSLIETPGHPWPAPLSANGLEPVSVSFPDEYGEEYSALDTRPASAFLSVEDGEENDALHERPISAFVPRENDEEDDALDKRPAPAFVPGEDGEEDDAFHQRPVSASFADEDGEEDVLDKTPGPAFVLGEDGEGKDAFDKRPISASFADEDGEEEDALNKRTVSASAAGEDGEEGDAFDRQPVPHILPEADDAFDEQPAKKLKTNGTMYSGADAVDVVLGQTAELVLVLAGMAQLRAGRTPTSYERELAASAYQNLGLLVSRVAPNNLVSRESLERLHQEYNVKKMAQKMREEQAWVEALTEAEASANARAEALARAKAEADARTKAEAEELERTRQAALQTTALAANGPSIGGSPSVGGALSTGQTAHRVSELIDSPSLSTPTTHPSSEAQTVSQPLLAVSNAGEVPRLEMVSEKSVSVNGQSHTPASKPHLGRPPKVRNRIRKDSSAVTLFTPEFLNQVQNHAPEPQKTQVTHKQLCLGVQQFIREHIPPVSQTLQALPPTYISTPIPCQVCKLIAKDTGSVLVCDSCDEVSHVKCVQPPASKGASKGDWNCSKCLIAIRGGKYPSKYGPICRGSPNSVKLWPPHDKSEGSAEPIRSVARKSVRVEGESATDGRPVLSGVRKLLRKARLEIDTGSNQSNDDPSTGNVGNSPHLIVQLVNEPSPRTNDALQNSSQTLLKANHGRPFPPSQMVSTVLQTLPGQTNLVTSAAADDEIGLQEGTAMINSIQNDPARGVEPDKKSEIGLEKSNSPSKLEENVVLEVANSQSGAADAEEANPRTLSNQKRRHVDSKRILPGKQAEVPLPIVMEWVGESIRRAEGKVFYRACSVGGITFRVSDCALFRPETPDVPPYIARLQVLWEDTATGHKWVRVSWCYYPTDIPLSMGRPGGTEPNEVYESNHCDNNLVGSIQGPCIVLVPQKFREETERRNMLKRRGDVLDELPPIFLSRWMYDAPKGVFRPRQE